MSLRSDAQTIIAASIQAVQPDAAVRRALQGREFPDRVVLAAVGKAAWQMAKAARECLGNRMDAGVVVTKYGHVLGPIPGCTCYEAGHPVPDGNSFRGTQAVLDLVSGLTEQDTVIFLLSGGGSLLQDTTSTRSLLYYLSVIRCAQLLRRPVMLYANGIGPVRRPANRRRVRRVVERAALVTLRDHASAQELREMGVKRPALVTADPVFRLEPAGPERSAELLRSAGLEPGRPFVAVSVRDWHDVGDFYAQLAALCDHLRKKHGLELLFLLMQPERDREATRLVRSYMEEPSHVLEASTTPRELMGVLGQARLCLAMRLHTLIFAARMAVPAMGLVYDPKVASYLEELDLPAAGDVESFDGDEAIRRADALMADYDSVLARLREKSARLTRAAGENEWLLLELLERTKS